MYTIKRSGKFKKEFKKLQGSGNFETNIFLSAIDILQADKQLPRKYENHQLHGEFKDCFECHLKPNLLLIYKIEKGSKILHLLRIGSHPELFG